MTDALDEARCPFHGGLDLWQCGGKATAQKTFATDAEGTAWNASHLFLLQQPHGKIPGG